MKGLVETLMHFERTGEAEDAEKVLELAKIYLQKNLISSSVYAILESYVKGYIK